MAGSKFKEANITMTVVHSISMIHGRRSADRAICVGKSPPLHSAASDPRGSSGRLRQGVAKRCRLGACPGADEDAQLAAARQRAPQRVGARRVELGPAGEDFLRLGTWCAAGFEVLLQDLAGCAVSSRS